MHILRLTGSQWRAILEGLTRSPRAVLIGPTGLQRDPGIERVLGRELEAAEPDRLDRWRARWRELLIVGAMTEPSREAAHDLLARCGESAHHRIVVLGVGIDQAAGYMVGGCSFDGSWTALDRVEVIGAAMPQWDLSSDEHNGDPTEIHTADAERGADVAWLPEADAPGSRESGNASLPNLERWSRSIGALTLPIWRRLRELPVAVVGCGRSGSLAAQMLALLGVESLVLIDPDCVELGNLDAMFGVMARDVGRPKVDALAAGLARVQPDLRVTTISDTVQSTEAVRMLRRVELIVSTVDRDTPRLLVAQVADAFLKVHLDIGTGIFANHSGLSTTLAPDDLSASSVGTPDPVMGADVRLLLPGNGCIACVGGLRSERDARYGLLAPPGALRHGPRLKWWQQRAGSLPTINAAAVGCGIQLWLDVLAGRATDSRWVRLVWGDDSVLSAQVMRSHSTPCELCRQIGLGDFRFGQPTAA